MHQENVCHFFNVFLGLSSIFIGKQKCVPCSDSAYVFFPSFSYFVLLPETLLVLNRREATCACRSRLLFIDTLKAGLFLAMMKLRSHCSSYRQVACVALN